jgi:hypothetical protein
LFPENPGTGNPGKSHYIPDFPGKVGGKNVEIPGISRKIPGISTFFPFFPGNFLSREIWKP